VVTIKKMVDFNYIIIGGGMAGLYMGFQLRKRGVSFHILEKESRLGGRAWTESFAGVDVSPGAGIGRRRKDKRLMALMHELGLDIHFFRIKTFFSPVLTDLVNDFEPQELINQLYTSFLEHNRPAVSFRDFALQVWGEETYDKFIVLNGYSDMENEDISQTFFNYGLDDNLEVNWQGFSVPWAKLVQKMASCIGRRNISTNQAVVKLVNLANGFSVRTPEKQYTCNEVILAVPTRVIQKLLPQYADWYALVPDQPFLRTYVQFDDTSARIMEHFINGTTIVSNELQKIIPINKDKGVYMIAYSDNARALVGKRFRKKEVIQRLQEEFRMDQPLRILKLKHYFWKTGTHYYKPLSGSRQTFLEKIRHPEPGVYVIGEAVSLNQGWVEGALESVDEVLFA
jgi:monoamine oxidase